MKHIRNLLYVIIFLVFINLTGCYKNTNKSNIPNFNIEYLSFKPINVPDNNMYSFVEDPIKIQYLFENKSEMNKEFGIVLFIDGIVSKFKVGDDLDESYMNILKIKSNETKEIDIIFKPKLENNGRILPLRLIAINSPYTQISPNSEVHSLYETYETYGEFTPISIQMNSIQKESNSLKSSTDFSMLPISNEKKDEYTSEDGTNLLEHYVVFELIGNNIDNSIKIDKNKAYFTFKAYGAESYNCKTTFFINHEPIEVNGCNYLEYDIKKDYETSFQLEAYVNNVDMYNSLYAITSYSRIIESEEQNVFTKSATLIMINN